MKKILSLGFVSVAVLLVSCGQKNLDNVIVTPDTPIEKREQAAKVCEPMVKYISCSLEKSSEAGKGKLQNALKEMQRKINNDEPSKVAQECDNMIKVLTEKANIAFKNGCFVESAYKKTEVAPTTTPTISPTTTIKQ